MRIKLYLATLILAFAIVGCKGRNASAKNLNPEEFEKGIAQSDAQLVDVRTPQEYNEKHINTANNINFDNKDFTKRLDSLDKSKPIYFYCLSGGRSSKAANLAVKEGFSQVYELDHGLTGWMNAEKPIVTETGAAPSAGMSFDDYLGHIKQPGKLVLVDFNAVWCGPCRMLKPVVDKVVAKNADKVELLAIDVDKNPEVAKTMHIENIPLLILYKEGKEVWRNLGLIDEKEINGQINKFSM